MVSVTTSLPAEQVLDSAAIDRWVEALPTEIGQEDRDLLRKAAQFALTAGGARSLDTGEEQLRHALSVAELLATLRLDRETLAAAILLGVLHDQDLTRQDLNRRFGQTIASMVDDLERISGLIERSPISASKDQREHAENLRRLLLGIAEDVRVVLVVVAERLHLMRIARDLPEETQRRLAEETRDIYAPLANRLGIWQMKWELEDLMLRFLQPDDYKRIAKSLDGRRVEREKFIREVISLLDLRFREVGVEAEITGRPKHIYSIWRKMQRKGVDIEQIFDLRAIRVLVDDIAQCYAALGVVHGLWRHIPGEFDDYIATPKANLYQSIHTAVIGPEDKTLEVQIRTHDMHHHSELGVAAHWRYKENTKHDADFERRIVWMRNWLDLKDGDEVLSLNDLEAKSIYVLTPQGKVVELPKGATALDFAYAIHTELGHRCRGAMVDGHIVQLIRPLNSGETVEILTTKTGTPSRDWLNSQLGYLHTSKARNRVKQWFKQLDFDHHVDLGRAALEREMIRLSITQRPDLELVAAKHNLKQVEDVYAAIGRGDLSPIQVAGFTGQPKPERTLPPVPKVRHEQAVHGEITIDGVDDLLTSMAGCCRPVPQDPIIGYITRGRGVTVHRRNCPNILAMGEEDRGRLVEVEWSNAQENTAFPVDIEVISNDRKGLLRDISAIIANEEVDVVGVNTLTDKKTYIANMQFTVEVLDMEQLSRLLLKIEQLPDVIEAKRRV